MAEIGETLRQLRKEKGLTLEQVAKAADCSASFVSQIELDKVSPSITTLKRIANVLNVHMADFFPSPQDPPKVVTKVSERIALSLPRWRAKMNLLVGRGPGKRMQPFYTEIEPGGGAYGQYTHDGEEFGIVLEGELEVNLDGSIHRLSAGESFYYSSKLPHSWVNPTKGKTVVVWVVSPPTF